MSAEEAHIAPSAGFKRKRLLDIEGLDEFADDQLASQSFKPGRCSSATLKLHAQLDEFKILNEQLKEQLRAYKDEHDLFKEQSLRQMKFLEESNARYKSQYEQTSAKYYKEKKDWQAKTRELEHELQQKKQMLSLQGGAGESSAGRSRSSLGGDRYSLDGADELLRHQIAELSERLAAKEREASLRLAEKLELEKKVFKLEQEARTLQTVTAGSADDALELRTLRKKVNELETTLRRKSKEYEKYDLKLKNQVLMEEELATAQLQLSLAQSSLKNLHTMQAQYDRLMEEKRSWTQLFADILPREEVSTENAPSACTATRALTMLRDLQQKHVLLTQQHNDCEIALVQMRRQTLKLESEAREFEKERSASRATIEKLEAKLSAASNEAQCFEGEISSLRNLLKTFDVEFSIGKPDGARMLAMKDQVIAELRDDLDKTRKVLLENTDKVKRLENELATKSAVSTEQSSVMDANIPSAADDAVNEKFEELKSDFSALQEITGLDFLPHKTRILHMQHNPSSFLSNRPGFEAHSSMPQDVVKRLKDRVQTLTSQLQSAAPAAPAPHQPSDVSIMIENNQNMSILNKSSVGSGIDANKMNQRLKEIFKEKISTLREAVYLLSGYKMELYSEDPTNPNSLQRIRLKSMYAETPDDCLLFQLRDNCPELLESDFANNLDPTLLMYLTHYNSVPAFLAAVTLNLFENQTQM